MLLQKTNKFSLRTESSAMWIYTEIHSVHLYGNSDTSLAHENQREFLTEYLNNSDTFLKVWKLIFLNPFFF